MRLCSRALVLSEPVLCGKLAEMASRRAARALTFQLQRAGEPELWVNYAVSAPGQQAERGGAAAWGWGKVTEYAQRQWDAVKQAPEGSLKHRVYKGANWALDRVAPDEVALRHLANADALVLLVPEGVSPAAAQQRLQRLGAARYSIHNHYLGLSYLGAAGRSLFAPRRLLI